MKNQVNSSFNQIPYVEVLAKDEEDVKSFGLDKLINITIQQCKSAFESKIFEEMREEINQTLIKNLKKKIYQLIIWLIMNQFHILLSILIN